MNFNVIHVRKASHHLGASTRVSYPPIHPAGVYTGGAAAAPPGYPLSAAPPVYPYPPASSSRRFDLLGMAQRNELPSRYGRGTAV